MPKQTKFYRARARWGLLLPLVIIIVFVAHSSPIVPLLRSLESARRVFSAADPLLQLFLLLVAVGGVLFVGAIVFYLLEAVALIWLDCVTLHWKRGTITYRGREIGRIDQIRTVYLRTVHQPKETSYLSSLRMQDGYLIWLEENNNLHKTTANANRVARLANVRLKRLE